jgi:hypothetical protein
MQAKTELLKVVVRQKLVKFIYSEKAAKFCEIFTFLLTTVHTVKSKVKISQNFVAFSEYMNFNQSQDSRPFEYDVKD